MVEFFIYIMFALLNYKIICIFVQASLSLINIQRLTVRNVRTIPTMKAPILSVLSSFKINPNNYIK